MLMRGKQGNPSKARELRASELQSGSDFSVTSKLFQSKHRKLASA